MRRHFVTIVIHHCRYITLQPIWLMHWCGCNPTLMLQGERFRGSEDGFTRLGFEVCYVIESPLFLRGIGNLNINMRWLMLTVDRNREGVRRSIQLGHSRTRQLCGSKWTVPVGQSARYTQLGCSLMCCVNRDNATR